MVELLGGPSLPSQFVAALTPLGKRWAREGPPAPERGTVNIGTGTRDGFGPVQGVARAEPGATVTQNVNDPAAIRAEVEVLTSRLLEAVRAEVSAASLQAVSQAAEDLRRELGSATRDEGVVKRALDTLSVQSNLEGTVALTYRVWPYLSRLVELAATAGQ